MLDPSMMGLYGLGAQEGGQPMARNSLAASLIGGFGKPVYGGAAGASQLGQGLIAAMLMSPKGTRNLFDQMGWKIGNLFGGYDMSGMPRSGQMGMLNQQAMNNVAGGAAGL